MRKISIIFLPFNLNMCFGCSKEPSHWDGSFEYPQQMLWMRNKENNFANTHSYLEAWECIYLINEFNFWNVHGIMNTSGLLQSKWSPSCNFARPKVSMIPWIFQKFNLLLIFTFYYKYIWERSGSVVECLTRDRRVAGSSLTGVTALWSLSKTHLS